MLTQKILKENEHVILDNYHLNLEIDLYLQDSNVHRVRDARNDIDYLCKYICIGDDNTVHIGGSDPWKP